MSWRLSRFRAGELVEIRSKEEILASLDEQGCLEGMPFMPEMLQYCGRKVRVASVAHKTCDVAHKTMKSRRLESSVHLEGSRCDGSAHGGCQADCNLFWKDVWLRPVGGETRATLPAAVTGRRANGISESELIRSTQVAPGDGEGGPVYSCQAMRLFEATAPLAWWNPMQYLRDVTTGNNSVRHALSVLVVAAARFINVNAPRGYRLTRSLYASIHRRLLGRELPSFHGSIPLGQPTPTAQLNLRPGERVRIKSTEEIAATLDMAGRNRGLFCDLELSPYCGAVATVRKSVTQFIDESTGRMQHTKQPCIMLEGVVCRSEYSTCRLLCPRAIPSWWREIWLERVPGEQEAPGRPAEAR
jgi:hypothetical protein